MKHIIWLVAILSLFTAFATQDDKHEVQEAKHETASVSVAETAG